MVKKNDIKDRHLGFSKQRRDVKPLKCTTQSRKICLGNMIKPRTWFDPEGTDGNHRGCGILHGLPHHTEFEEETGDPTGLLSHVKEKDDKEWQKSLLPG